MTAVVVDTSGLFALANRRDRNHAVTARFVQEGTELLLVPVTVLTEADYLLASRIGTLASTAVMRSIGLGQFQLEQVTRADLLRASDLMEQYADSELGVVDATIVAIAERLDITQILTLDRRDFRIIQPRHCAAFELLPELA